MAKREPIYQYKKGKAMTKTEVLQQLEAMGTAQNRKVYGRHGVQGKQYGVSIANLKTLKKQIKTDQPLAQALWETKNHDARILATMIAVPKELDETTIERWRQDLDNYVITDAFSGLISRTPLAQQNMERWTASGNEWTGQAGWNILTHLAMNNKALTDDYFRPYLAIIQQDIHHRKNRIRHSMNNALIAIGLRNEILQQEAVAIATTIGKVDVDHGQTNCKTPDAIAYIERSLARKRK